MVARVLIIGGYGNFGSYIARSLASDTDIQLLIGGRSVAKAAAFIETLAPVHIAEAHFIDITGDLGQALARIAPDIVIHTTGPPDAGLPGGTGLYRPAMPLSGPGRRA